MGSSRRVFLRQMGVALGALGLSEAGLSLLADQYQQAIALPTPRKLALLVGINQYTEPVCDFAPSRGAALSGCLTDVELQRELLIHRFGFQPNDIISLTDQQATRAAVVEAFQSHLMQAKPGDVVVFHFSGLGSRVKLTDEQTESIVEQNSLVPVDGMLPTEDNPVINDLREEMLGLLLQTLPTQQITTILDAGFTTLGRILQGNLQIRSRPNAPSGRISDADRMLLQISPPATGLGLLGQALGQAKFPGILLAAAAANQVATEAQWNGFSAGLFTYALTQRLWWATPPTVLHFVLNQAAGTVHQLAGVEQQPHFAGQLLQKQPPVYNTNSTSTSAEGFVRAIEEDGKVQLWLGGLPAPVLENYGASVLTVGETGMLQVRSREGLTAKARATPDTILQVGQFVRERVRLLPRNVGLTVAIDTSLERIERVDATSAFSAIPRVSSVIAGEQPADFLFGKTQDHQTLTASLEPELYTPVNEANSLKAGAVAQNMASPAQSSTAPKAKLKTQTSPQTGYGLFYPGRDAIPNTLISIDEAVKTAVNRLTPQLRTLLAAKLLRLTENAGSSRLGVKATLATVSPQEQIVLQQETARWQNPADTAASRKSSVSKLAGLLASSNTVANGSEIQYRLLNYSDHPVYFILLGLDIGGNAIAFYPSEAADETMIAPGETLVLPQTIATSDWVIQRTGLAETHLIFSRSPLRQAYQTLETEGRSKTDARRVTLLQNPLEVVQAVLEDLHQASTAVVPKMEIAADTYALDVNAWATLSFVYQVT
ncbi:caspase family protein [Phormidium tenue FACHB-886]|nr:caspase family protein [Phormidium tenue FACHB-886]